VREIDTLQSHERRKQVWEQMKARHGLDEMGRQYREFRRINQSSLGAAAGLLRNFPDWAYFNAKRLARRLIPRATHHQR